MFRLTSRLLASLSQERLCVTRRPEVMTGWL